MILFTQRIRDSKESLEKNESKWLLELGTDLGSNMTNKKELNEVSKETLKRYIPKAEFSAKAHDHMSNIHAGVGGKRKQHDVHDMQSLKHMWKADDRRQNIEKAKNKISEEQQLDELSSSTLTKYSIKAGGDRQLHSAQAGLAMTRANGPRGESEVKTQMAKNGQKHALKAYNRAVGMQRAMKKLVKKPETAGVCEDILIEHNINDYKLKHVQGLYHYHHFEHPNGSWIQTHVKRKEFIHSDGKGNHKKFDNIEDLKKHVESLKEEVELNEISKKLAGRYIEVAKHDISAHAGWSGYEARGEADRGDKKPTKARKYHDDKLTNRLVGVGRAVEKLTKEEVQIDEISKSSLYKYINHSAMNRDKHNDKEDFLRDKMYHAANNDEPELHKKFSDAAEKHNKKADKRTRGIFRATDKIMKRSRVPATEELLLTYKELIEGSIKKKGRPKKPRHEDGEIVNDPNA